MNAKNAVLPIVCTALAALYFLHPLIQAARKNTLPVKSAIINPVEKNDIVQITLEAADGSKITLAKIGNLWTGHINGLNAIFPCVTVQVDSFIDELTAIKKTYRAPQGKLYVRKTAQILSCHGRLQAEKRSPCTSAEGIFPRRCALSKRKTAR